MDVDIALISLKTIQFNSNSNSNLQHRYTGEDENIDVASTWLRRMQKMDAVSTWLRRMHVWMQHLLGDASITDPGRT